MTQASDLYNYVSFFETVLKYVIDASASHLTNAFWYFDNDDLLPCDPTAANAKNNGFITLWDRIKQRKDLEHYGRIHSEICNVAQHLLPRVRMQIKLTKARRSF